jgi:hypothetical protein
MSICLDMATVITSAGRRADRLPNLDQRIASGPTSVRNVVSDFAARWVCNQ